MTVGKTKDAGWEIGVSKTLHYPRETIWQVLDTRPETWLGAGAAIPQDKGEQWSAEDGTTGELRSRRENDRIRLTWRPPGWIHDSTVQVAVSQASSGTVVRFHQERLADATEREAQRLHWLAVMDRLERALAEPNVESDT